MLTCDGFASHVNTTEALELFDENKIMLVEEEGDLSHISQIFDQQPAKCNKLEICYLLDMVRTHVRSNLDQYILVATLCCTLNKTRQTNM